MTSSLSSRTLRCAWLLVACTTSVSGWAQSASAVPVATQAKSNAASNITFKEVLEAVWLRHPDAVAARSTRREAQALDQVGQSWMAGQPTAKVSQTEGLSASTRNEQATELGVSLPIWQWGQRHQTQQQARAWEALAQAQSSWVRWRLAGEVHDQAVRLWLADAELQDLSAQVQAMTELDRDVQRRVRAGDLAPVDALASEAELLSLQSLVASAQQARAAQQASWRQWVGDVPAPPPGSWPVAELAQAPTHPVLQWHQTQRELARIKLEAAQARWGATPELEFSIKQEGRAIERSQSATVALSFPLGKTVHRQTDLALAMAEADRAEAEAQQAERQVASAREEAHWALDSIQQQAQAEGQRAQLLQRRAEWLQKSFKAGETELPELLRAKAAAAQANASRIQKDIQQIAAQTRLHWAQGYLP